MKKIKMTIAYDGTHYSGWQIQQNGLAIQEVIEKGLQAILKEPVRIVGAGRTDAGVHAHGQIAHFETMQEPDLHRLALSLNGVLPRDIRIGGVSFAPLDFHA